MTTPDTEWEKKAIDAIIASYPEDIWPEPEYKPHDAEVSWVMREMSKAIASILKPVVEEIITSRDTYWKERVRNMAEKSVNSVEFTEETTEEEKLKIKNKMMEFLLSDEDNLK